MGAVTQINAKVLVGLLADRPNAGGIDQGVLFHSSDTLECFILVIDHLTQVRRWDPFCGYAGGVAAFANELPVSDEVLVEQFMDNAGVTTFGTTDPQHYPVGTTTRVVRMSAFIEPTVPLGSVVEFRLYVNGAPTAVVLTYAAGDSGLKTTAAAPLPATLVSGNTFDIHVQATPGQQISLMVSSATLLFG